MAVKNIDVLFMHIPDGFLSLPVAVLGWITAFLLIGLALRRTQKVHEERHLPLLGVLAAFVFAAQTINFPVAAGTSGHLLGGALLAIIVGPWTAAVVMTAVIIIQGLLFQDGGLLVMGWNIINMAFITTLSSAIIFSGAKRVLPDGRLALIFGGALAAWISVELAAVATAIQLAASGIVALNLALAAMASVHILIGTAEAIITVAALLLVWRVRPDLLNFGQVKARPNWGQGIEVAIALAIVMAAVAISLFASDLPDGLERAALNLGFETRAAEPALSLLTDYTIPALGNSPAAGIAAVAAGTAVVFGLVFVLSRLLRRSGKTATSARRES